MFANWVIWYADGSSFSSLDGEPQFAPGSGCLVIRHRDGDVGNKMIWPETAYCWHINEQQWFSHDWPGYVLHVAKPGWHKTVWGESVLTQAFIDVVNDSARDPRLPRKSAYLQYEFHQPWMELP